MSKPIKLKKADASYLPLLKELWLCCFKDDRPEDVDAFYTALFSKTECLVGLVDDRPVTMLHLLPATAYVCGASYAVRYLYAGCTHPDHRYCGYYASLMRFAEEYVAEMGEKGIYLHPATPQLVPLYEKAGYKMCINSAVPVRLGVSEKDETISAVTCATERHNVLRCLQHPCVYFEPDIAVSTMFVEALSCKGVRLYTRGGDVFMEKDGMRLHPLPPLSATEPAAMWLGVGECCPVFDAIDALGGYTALLGE